ncbi:hypothetical protein BCV70DRAFT_155088 [Testicularia cyperi]|uniref:Actin cytoskeleton-regulatory complex protein SLA1 n=1 Tax=Testicularia cyperi TaxID=1882483 RepID=A0A317XZD9_9BASI|nr:hypothetical protein BCV70DRAFT_155088 [Testicularia cyperi]
MAYVALGKALYDYVAQAEDELSLTEDDYLYILESDDPEWWKAKLRRLDQDGTPLQDDSDEGVVGLVPANYVEEAEPIRLSRALYDYEAQTEDELSMAEDELLRIYESDGLWLLVKKQGNDPLSGGEGRLGYVPANYVDDADAVDTGAAPVTEGEYDYAQPNGDANEDDDDDEDDDVSFSNPTAAASIPQISLPPIANIGKSDEIKMWPVSALDGKKKKKKGTLGIGNASLFFASESDKTPVQKISVLHITNYTLEKGKSLHLDLSPDAGVEESILDFHTGSKDAGNDIIKKLEASKANALTAAAAADRNAADPPVPPPAPAPPVAPLAPTPPAASTATLPPPTRTAAAVLPPPVRKTVSFQSQRPEAPETQDEHAIALYDFEAQGDDELSVAENEHLVILEKENDEWWKVRNDSGQEGVVPASYVEASDAAASAVGAGGAGAAAAAAASEEEESRQREEAEAAVVAEAERQREAAEAAEAAERHRRETEERRQREQQERTRRDALKAQPAPAPPKLTQRPSTTEVTRAAKNVSIPQGRSAPERPKDGGGRSKPSPNNTRMWTDRTGQFKVEAEFLGFNQGKIRLHKMNGVVIEVAVEKMSDGDINFLEEITGKKLQPNDDEIAASVSRRRESSRATQQMSSSGPSREERERERERRKEKEREQRRREQARSGPKRNVDWFEFFLAAGVDVDECTRYASAFERDKIDETVLGDLDSGTLRSMGLREGDIIRVNKLIDRKYRRNKHASSSSSSSRQSGKANANTAADLERQIKADEELARKLQDQESAARRGDSASPAPPQLFSGPDGTLKNNTRRGRPTPRTTSGSNVDPASLAAASESLARTATPPARAGTISPSTAPKRTGSSLANGFDDDAWTPRPPSTKPATPARPTVASPAPAATAAAPPAPTPPPALAPAAPANVSTPDPNSALFEKLAAMRPPSAGVSPRPGASPSPMSSFMGQNQAAYNPNAPRGPYAPVPANQGLLQPLVPTQGTGQFVPTKMQPQATGMMGMGGMQPQQTGWGNMGLIQPQMTGFNGMGGMNGMQSQATGFGQFNGGMMGSPSGFGAGGQLTMQQTGFPGMQPQATGFGGQFGGSAGGGGMSAQQMMAQQTGFGVGSQQQQQQQDDKEKFNASNIFQQMKSGQFAKDPNVAPQASDKYDALRPQPTGFQPGGVMPQFTGMNFGSQQQPFGNQQGGYGGYGGGY